MDRSWPRDEMSCGLGLPERTRYRPGRRRGVDLPNRIALSGPAPRPVETGVPEVWSHGLGHRRISATRSRSEQKVLADPAFWVELFDCHGVLLSALKAVRFSFEAACKFRTSPTDHISHAKTNPKGIH